MLIPARNEVDNIPTLLAKVATAMQSLEQRGFSGELVLIDDGSTDGTGDLARGLQADYPFLRLFTHRRNLGLT
ncbi:MAG: glycosyltransferase, partial [Anaerolineae bacterium]|nr:glycosyltransferase [Anaerolineae bacterium]